jgi:hypothetical protein
MLKKILCFIGWFRSKPCLVLLVGLLLMTQDLSAQATPKNVPMGAEPSVVPSSQTSREVPEEIAPDMIEPGVQLDPLDSPHPIPWNWVMATHNELSASRRFGTRYYRSQSLVSPDGQYAAYSRIQLQGQPELYYSRVTSVMFVENLQTGDLRTITPSSPLADNPLISHEEGDMPGTISILIPVSWSKSSDRLLARQFEGMLSTSDASDYAVVWDRKQNRISTIAPERIEYSYAVLLGWSQSHPDQVLFRAGELGDVRPPVWAVNLNRQTSLALEDEPTIYGQVVNQVWAGPQARW